jgi:hypothetical protein
MAQKSGFFNALLNAGVYDRTYNADDYTDNLAVVIGNGVLRSENNDLQVTASGLNISVAAGRAWINGHYYYNDSVYTLPAITPPTGGARIDRVVLRMNKTLPVRAMSIQYLTGTAATSPQPPSFTRDEDIYDLVLADISISANATSCTITDQRANKALCGWVYSTSGDDSFFTTLDNSFQTWFQSVKDTLSSVTLFKRYTWITTLATATNTVQFNIPQYDAETDFIEVYVNGFLTDSYTANNNVITFAAQLNAGATIIVNSYKSIDGTGINSVADEITQLQNQVAALNGDCKFVYNCTGENDNISLSQIAEAIHTAVIPSDATAAATAFLESCGGLTWLQNLEADSQVTIDVVGRVGVGNPYYGSGAAGNRYRYFSFGETSQTDIKIVFDFAKADTISITCKQSTSNIIFYGTDLYIKNASVFVINVSGGCNIQMIAGSNIGTISVENCRFTVDTTGDAIIAAHGTFTNCDCVCKSSVGNANCFKITSNFLVRVIGGRYLAYVKNTTNYTAAVFYISSGQGNAVAMAQNINCPTISVANYYQQYLACSNSGKILIDMVTSTMNSTGSGNTIQNQVWLSKAY